MSARLLSMDSFLTMAEEVALHHGFSSLQFMHIAPGAGPGGFPPEPGAYIQLTEVPQPYAVGESKVIYIGHTSCASGLRRRPGALTSNAMARALAGDPNILDRFQWGARRGGATFAYTTALGTTTCTTNALESALLLAFWQSHLGAPRFCHADTTSSRCDCP